MGVPVKILVVFLELAGAMMVVYVFVIWRYCTATRKERD